MHVNISVEQIKVWAHHGVYQEERVTGRYFLVDVSVIAELNEKELLKDELSATYNYEMIAEIVQEEMQDTCALLEKKAIHMAQKIKMSDARIIQVKLKLSKLNPPLPGVVGSTAVEILV